MVAPNSPIAFAKPSTMPASTPGSASGNVTVAKTRQVLHPACLPPAPAFSVHGFDRQPDRSHQQRKRYDAAGQRRAGPAKREHDAEMVREPRPDRPRLPKVSSSR